MHLTLFNSRQVIHGRAYFLIVLVIMGSIVNYIRFSLQLFSSVVHGRSLQQNTRTRLGDRRLHDKASSMLLLEGTGQFRIIIRLAHLRDVALSISLKAAHWHLWLVRDPWLGLKLDRTSDDRLSRHDHRRCRWYALDVLSCCDSWIKIYPARCQVGAGLEGHRLARGFEHGISL